MEILILFIVCCYLNYSRARLAQFSGLKWALLTFIAAFAGLIIGCFAILFSLVSKDAELKNMILQVPQDRNAIALYLQDKITFLHHLLILFCGIGGYLFTRYILNKKIEKRTDKPIN